VELFAEKYDIYSQTRNRQEAAFSAKKQALDELYKEFRLPVDVPEPIFVKQMLDKEHCLVCDREAPNGSAAYQKILELLERSKAHKQKPKAGTHHQTRFFKRIQKPVSKRLEPARHD
jgi:DNA sulfur modification protein DndD